MVPRGERASDEAAKRGAVGGWKRREAVNQEGPRSLVPLPPHSRTHLGYRRAEEVPTISVDL